MNFWKDKNILITGGNGFIGSHLVEMLLERDSKITVPYIDNKGYFVGSIKYIEGDLKDPKFCNEITKDKDIVMNLAGKVGGIEYNNLHHGSLFRDNTLVFMNVLEAARKNNVERFLTVSSACVYPRFCTIPTPEEEGFRDMPEPTNEGYGFSKRVQERLSQYYTKEFGMKIGIARPYNAYGPRDNFNPKISHVIPTLIKKAFECGEEFVIWGDGEQSRAFLYVEDLCRGLILTTEKYCEADPINIGMNEETKIKDLVGLILNIIGKKPKLIYDTSKPSGQPRRNCDTSKAEERIGFKARISLEEGLKRTIKWYKKSKNNKNIGRCF